MTWGLAEEKDSVVFDDDEEEFPLECDPDPLPEVLLPEEKSPPRRPWGLLKIEESQEESPKRRRVRNVSDPDSRLRKPLPFMAPPYFLRTGKLTARLLRPAHAPCPSEASRIPKDSMI